MQLLTTRHVIVRIAAIVSLAELPIMLMLRSIAHEAGIFLEAVIDMTALVVLSTPPIYFWVVKPFVTARDEALAQVSHLAFTDSLTQLANRRLLLRHLEKFIAAGVRHKTYGALLLIDLDDFKPINDAHGHEAGDAVLVEIAQRLQSVTRSEDVVGRLGGDEFAVLVGRLDTDEPLARHKTIRIAEKLLDQLGRPFDFRGETLRIGASIGIRLLGIEGLSPEAAIREADIAMYRAKQAGKRGIASFTHSDS